VSQRSSGYERNERDSYETPEWVTKAVLPHLPRRFCKIWEPAAGSLKMVRALYDGGCDVVGTDIASGTDFLRDNRRTEAVVTNPPYALAREFIEHALALTAPTRGYVAMLLRMDYDHAKTRAHLFSEEPAFAKKLVLTRRIVWFEGPQKAAPSFNHAWFVWDWLHRGPPIIVYDRQLPTE
jgi:hypothetical protein